MQLEYLSEIIKKIRELPKDAAIAITDSNRFIYYQPGEKIDISIKPGEELREGTVSLKAIQLKKMVATAVDENIFGKPYYATGYPILNNGNVEGVITAIFPPTVKRFQDEAVPSFLIGKKDDIWVPIALKDILFITSEEGKTFIYTEKERLQNKYNLMELEYRLPTEHFVRCHRSFIVQMNAIEEIQPNFHSTFLLIMKDTKRTRIPVSQNYASYFRRILGF